MKSSANRRGSAALTLLSLLISMAIIMLILKILLFPVGNPSGTGEKAAESLPKQALDRGESVTCMQNLRSVRQSLDMSRVDDDTQNPASLEQLPEYRSNPQIFKCAVGGEAYVYDPQSGTVHCPHPGHEKF